MYGKINEKCGGCKYLLEPNTPKGCMSCNNNSNYEAREIIDIDDELKMFFNETLVMQDLMPKPQKTTFFMPEIVKVIFNKPATIVFWSDDTKTIVKCSDNEPFDKEKGLAMAIVKKVYGNCGNYYNEFKKWLPKNLLNKNCDAFDKDIEAIPKYYIKDVEEKNCRNCRYHSNLLTDYPCSKCATKNDLFSKWEPREK